MDYVYYTLVMKNGAVTNTMIYRMPDGAFIPMDENNGHYRAHLDWVGAGNVAPVISSPDEAHANPTAVTTHPVPPKKIDPTTNPISEEKR